MASAAKNNGASSRLADGARQSKKPSADNGADSAPTPTISATTPAATPTPTEFKANLLCWPTKLPPEFVEKIRELEQCLQMEVWLLLQGAEKIDFGVFRKFVEKKALLPQPALVKGVIQPKIAVLLDSSGGSGESAYQLATLLQRRCGGFAVVVPRWAKSAATLFALGANSILLGEDAELGPLDAQIWDADVEEGIVSALDEVQAVEALEQSATHTAMTVTNYLHDRTGKSFNVVLPHALHFAAELTKPLFEKIDAVRYSRQTRRLQEAQDYAERLLHQRFPEEQAKAIAKDLVRNYPTHGFVIDRQEARRVGKIEKRVMPVGLQLGEVSPELNSLLDWFYLNLSNIWAMGKLEPV